MHGDELRASVGDARRHARRRSLQLPQQRDRGRPNPLRVSAAVAVRQVSLEERASRGGRRARLAGRDGGRASGFAFVSRDAGRRRRGRRRRRMRVRAIRAGRWSRPTPTRRADRSGSRTGRPVARGAHRPGALNRNRPVSGSAVIPRSTTAALAKASFRFRSLMSAPRGRSARRPHHWRSCRRMPGRPADIARVSTTDRPPVRAWLRRRAAMRSRVWMRSGLR